MWAMDSDIVFPPDLLDLIQKKITETSVENSENRELVWRHFGGPFAQNLMEILGDYPESSDEEKVKAVLVASELSFRFSLGSFFSDFEEIQTISIIVFETILRARLSHLSSKQLFGALAIGLEKMPYCQFSFSTEDRIQWKLLSAWVQLSLERTEKIVWRPEIFLSGALSGLGETWLSEQLQWSSIISLNCWYSALFGLEDIYKRHVKAADKRLRPDQILSIEIELPHFLSGIPDAELRKMVAHYCTHFSWENLGQTQTEAQEILSRIQVDYSVIRSFEYWEKYLQTLPNLFAGVSETLFDKYKLSGFSEKRKLRKLLQPLRYTSRKWGKPTSKLHFGFSSSVVIYTTRGGKWTSNF